MGMYVGIDGCRAGWIAVTLDLSGVSQTRVFSTISSLWAACKADETEVILIDVPIGLPEQGRRACDSEARQLLGRRGSSVFAVPTRAAIYASAYSEGSQINKLVTGRMFSRQLWNITPKIREVDALVRMDAFARERFKETHPEVIFTMLAGHPPIHVKKSDAGYEERLKLLEVYFTGARTLVEEALSRFKRSEVVRDDVVDALASAVAARLGTLVSIPASPETDAYGLPMQILYARAPGLIRLHHAQITIPKTAEDDARTFYLDVLGLREIPKPESLLARGGFWVMLGDVQIHISLQDGVDRATSNAHLAYQVNDLEYWSETLKQRGIEIGESIPIPGYKRFEFRDPFGNRVEFIQPV